VLQFRQLPLDAMSETRTASNVLIAAIALPALVSCVTVVLESFISVSQMRASSFWPVFRVFERAPAFAAMSTLFIPVQIYLMARREGELASGRNFFFLAVTVLASFTLLLPMLTWYD
jgi:hypothetical protein